MIDDGKEDEPHFFREPGIRDRRYNNVNEIVNSIPPHPAQTRAPALAAQCNVVSVTWPLSLQVRQNKFYWTKMESHQHHHLRSHHEPNGGHQPISEKFFGHT